MNVLARRRSGRLAPVRAVAVLAAVLVGGSTLAACGSSSAASVGAATLTLYNAQHEQTTNELVAAFTTRTGITVRVKNDDEAVLTAQLEQEGSRSPADVFYTENSNWLQQLAERGQLSKVDPATLAAVPKQDSAADADWVGVSARVSAMVYDPDKISPAQLPKSILDLAEPTYHGEFELAPSETDFWPLVASVAKAKGDAAALAWLKALQANASEDNVPDNETLVSDVARGTTDFAVINHYYYYRQQATSANGVGNAKLAYFAPHDPGYLETISGAAVLKSSKHQAEAQKLVAFLVSHTGQTTLERGDSFEYPLRAGVAANPKLPPLSGYQPNSFSPADLGTGVVAKTLLQQAGLL
jgi:iron(III) transport system substrate-binding protein